MPPRPFVTRLTTVASAGFASSRFGPTVPLAPAAERVWQPAQPELAKTAFPAAGSPPRFPTGVVEVVGLATGTAAFAEWPKAQPNAPAETARPPATASSTTRRERRGEGTRSTP